MKALNAIRMGGVDILPLVEGGKGVAVSDGVTCGHWAASGGVGTFSAVNADSYDADGHRIAQVYHGRTRRDRHEELVDYAIKGGIAQAQQAHEINGGAGRIHANILWEMGGAERVITGVLEGAKGLINGLTCGAGMPYRLSDIATKFGVHYYPIVSSARAFSALWKRAYHKASNLLGGVVYEDPWLAGGHNGLSNSEDPARPEDPFPRVLALRKQMRAFGLDDTPIIMAGGVWWLEEWEDWIDNPELGPIAFQFGTRPLLTQESPIGNSWKQKLLTLKRGDVFLNRFSPTGFYSSAVNNGFIQELRGRSERQVAYTTEVVGEHTAEFGVGPRKRIVYLTRPDLVRVRQWLAQGFSEGAAHPGHHADLRDPGNGRADIPGSGGLHGLPQPVPILELEPGGGLNSRMARRPIRAASAFRKRCRRSGMRRKAEVSAEDNLMFSGHNGFRFALDPFYSNGFIPTVKQLFRADHHGPLRAACPQ